MFFYSFDLIKFIKLFNKIDDCYYQIYLIKCKIVKLVKSMFTLLP